MGIQEMKKETLEFLKLRLKDNTEQSQLLRETMKDQNVPEGDYNEMQIQVEDYQSENELIRKIIRMEKK